MLLSINWSEVGSMHFIHLSSKIECRARKMSFGVAIKCSMCIPNVNARAQKFEPASIPKIDFNGLSPNAETRSLFIEDVGNACRTLGSFQVINHGISKSVINGAMEVAAGFFALPQEEKREFQSEDVYEPVRYGFCSKDERLVKPRDFLKQYAHPLCEWIKLWPRSPTDYREKMGKYSVEIRRVALQVMDAILESLGLGQGYIKEALNEGMQVITLNNYEQCSKMPNPIIGLAPHSDYGCVTILLQSCEGLQIFRKDLNTWQAVSLESPYALHVHIGDFLEVLSNGKYKSVAHRVVLDRKKRMSIASIHGLSMDEKVTAAEELVDEQHPKGYKDGSFRDFLEYISKNDFTKESSFIDNLRIINSQVTEKPSHAQNLLKKCNP